jgi:DNA-binding CsgD family transcriptional regulator
VRSCAPRAGCPLSLLSKPVDAVEVRLVTGLDSPRGLARGRAPPRVARRLRLPARPRRELSAQPTASSPRPTPTTHDRATAAPSGAIRPGEAAEELRAEVKAGRLDGDAAGAVLEAAGHPVRARRGWPGGLTAREVEVLALLARGHPNKEIARRLHLSPKTVGNHVEHIYAKIDVRTRAAATLFATRHDLLGSPEQ